MKTHGIPARHVVWQRAFFFVFMAAILFSLVGFHRSRVAKALNRGERVPILIFGIDAADKSQHTDTLLLAVFDPLMNYLRVLSIPRDTLIHLPGYKFHRINEVYGYFQRIGLIPMEASKKVVEAVQHILSLSDTPSTTPYFVQVDFNGFSEIVDLVGGVWVDIKTPMHYDDNAGNYHFHKEPGRYLLRGREAINYVRFRGLTGDKGRIMRQQEFLKLLAQRASNPINFIRFPKMAVAVRSSIITNLSFWDLVYLATDSRRIRPEKIGFFILPGVPKGPFWSVKKDAAAALADFIVSGKGGMGESFKTIVPQEGHVTVKVWNASGRPGAAYVVTKYLRAQGYDVVDWGNYPAVQIPTRVIDRSGKLMKAQELADLMGIDNSHSEPNPKALVDVEVIIGQNYNGLSMLKED